MFYAENSCDQVIRSFFPDTEYRGVFVEVGAARPDFISMSRHFRETGWLTVAIEPNPLFAEMQRLAGVRTIEVAISDYNKDDASFHIYTTNGHYENGIVSMESFSSLNPWARTQNFIDSGCIQKEEVIKVTVRTLNYIFENKEEYPQVADITKVDVMSIDTEGGELDVLRGFSVPHLQPHIYVIECFGDSITTEAEKKTAL